MIIPICALAFRSAEFVVTNIKLRGGTNDTFTSAHDR
jgi:hypothetical protein